MLEISDRKTAVFMSTGQAIAMAHLDGESGRDYILAQGLLPKAMGFYQDRVVPHLVNLAMRNRELAPYRKRTMALAEERVLEIGVGSGLNLPFYTDRTTEVLGLDPHPRLLRMAADRPGPVLVPSTLIEASAEYLR